MPDSASTRRRRARRRRVVAAAVTVVVVAAGGGTAWALTRSSATSYRVADVSRATIAQTVDADGSLAARNTATESFAAAGTVKSVAVKSGQQVTAGQTLATLDRSSLESAVSSAKNTLASAKQTLADNEAGQASTSSSTSAGSTGSGSTATDDAATTTGSADIVLVSDESDPSVSKARAEVRAAQKAVVRAQQSLDGDVADLTSSCTTAGDTETTEDVTADGDTASGTVDRTSV
ncbi:biotin/lipoyl-binding protein, partial [Jatrophihabitans endophyticus]|uniref:biotin/lipoyl-binding protein n=1 Tax=Jatrophihabitans endophyticus TaxID=1206085 RepID=UPI001A0D5F8D